MLKQTKPFLIARGLKRKLSPPGPVAVSQTRGELTVVNPPPAVEAGAAFPLGFTVTNRAGDAWPKSTGVRWGWETNRGQPFPDGGSGVIPFPAAAYPGEPLSVVGTVTAPPFVGDFKLVADLVHGSTEFVDTPAAKASIPVAGRRETDIDYHAVFRSADLAANHWWVVGAYHSKEQYERSSRERLGMLQKYGLTPDARVLDVGCGTGQMAGVLEPYLSDRGGYCGTDIGAEAIAFCDRTFRRRNFAFRVGGMTEIPFTAADGPFDLAIYFSVFTHTFADETTLLLHQTAAALAPGGRVIADVITSDLVDRDGGHRGEMIVNRTHFERLAGAVGLSADPIGTWEWNCHATRVMYVLSRKI